MKKIIKKLQGQQHLTVGECHTLIEEILSGGDEKMLGEVLTRLHDKGETGEEIQGFAEAMREHRVALTLNQPVIDIVGTGGDGANTVNISTAAALVVASSGVPVLKHGNRSSSSHCGSADVLEALHIPINIEPKKMNEVVETFNFGFCFAPNYHPAMKKIKVLRQQLGTPTIFNLLGPLLNPACAEYYVLGVANPKYLLAMAKALQKLKIKRALVVHGSGLDELNTLGPVDAILVTPETLEPFTIDPQALGFNYCRLSELQGGDCVLNAKRIMEFFQGKQDALADTIILNAAAALMVYGKVGSIAEGIHLAQGSVKNGVTLRWLTCITT